VSAELITLRCIVAANNSNGEPDLFFVKVTCSEDDYEHGLHYDAAAEASEQNGYDPRLSFDERDPAGQAMLHLFEWDTAHTVFVKWRGHK
jgi:hypothetical protein